MTVCTYDNPATWRRECWQDGRLICSYAAEVFFLPLNIPGEYLFFGANVGDWQPGRMVGDASALFTAGPSPAPAPRPTS